MVKSTTQPLIWVLQDKITLKPLSRATHDSYALEANNITLWTQHRLNNTYKPYVGNTMQTRHYTSNLIQLTTQ